MQTPDTLTIAGRDDLFSLSETRYAVLKNVGGTGKNFRIRSLTEAEKSDYETLTLTTKGQVNKDKLNDARRRLVALCLVDAQGNRICGDADVDKLKGIDGLITSHIYDECRVHCGFEDGDIEKLVKNSENVADSDSPSD